MRAKRETFLRLSALFLVVLMWSLLGQACQCGVNLISPTEWGARLLNTDLPEHNLAFPERFSTSPTTREFLLFNDGREKLSVASMKMLGEGMQMFRITKAPKTPFELAPGKDNGVKITVTFAPKYANEFVASIAFFSPHTNNTDKDDNFIVTIGAKYRKIGPVFSCGEVLDFGEVELGKAKTLECEVRNQGNADLVIESFKYVAKVGPVVDFKWEGPSMPMTLAAGGQEVKTIRITYTPSEHDPAEDEGEFIFKTNLPIQEEDSYPRLRVLGKAIFALVEIVPMYPPCQADDSCQTIDERLFCREDKISNQSLCRVKEGETALLKFPYTSRGRKTTRSFTIRSLGEIPLRVEQLFIVKPNTPEFQLPKDAIKLPLVLQPKEEKVVVVEYAPTDLIEDKDTLHVVSNAVNFPIAPVLLEGTPKGCDLVAEPLKLVFAQPQSLPVKVSNLGNGNCIIDSIALKSSRTEPFVLENLPEGGTVLGPGRSLTFAARYKPYGRKYPDFAVIKSNDPDEPEIEVELIPPEIDPPRCELQANPTLLNYGQVSVGLERTLKVTLKNKGLGPCNLSSLTIRGTDPVSNTAFSLVSPPQAPLRIAPEEETVLTVRYKPPGERYYRGNLVIVSNDPVNSNLVVQLMGTWGARCLEVIPQVVDFGSTRTGCSTGDQVVQVYHLGTPGCPSTVRITSARLSPGTSTEFRVTKTPNMPALLTAGRSVEFQLAYKAVDLGNDTGSFFIENSVPSQSPLIVPLSGSGVRADDQRDVFTQISRPKADILFVVDNSCSMREEQNSLANNFKSFINWASKLNVDYHIGITTTDVTGRSYPAGCLQGRFKYITQYTQNKEDTFSSNVRVGTSGSPIEQGLEAAYRALSTPTVDNTSCNAGFYRKDASLSLIIISDEKDQSPQPLNFYVNFFKNLKGSRNKDMVRGSVVVGQPPQGCNNPGTGRATPAPSYWSFAQQLNGVQASICQREWGGTLSKLGSVSFGYRNQFFLSRRPDVQSIIVRVDGKRITQSSTDGWTYNSVNNAIEFGPNAVPGPNSSIVVDYKALCL